MTRKLFGTDGVRGKANSYPMTAEMALKIGAAAGRYFRRDGSNVHRVVIGKDTRLSGYMFENALTAGLSASGADVCLMHVTTTPSVSFITRTDAFDCGIMITASHNSFNYNGIKLLNDQGAKMPQDIIDKVEKYLDGGYGELPFATGSNIGRVIDYSSGRNRYIGRLISLATHSYKDMRIGLDCANGSTWMMAKSIFETLGAHTVVIGNDPNGININSNCGSMHMENLRNIVVKNKLDVGFAFDGDADRCLAVDDTGRIIDGDLILYVYGKYMLDRGTLEKNTVVTTVMSNFGLYKAFDAAGIKYEKVPVGDKYVYECMHKNGYLLGGEQSGHIIFAKYAATGDGLLTAIKLMQAMLAQKQPLSALASDVTIYPQVLKNVKVTDKDAVLNDPAVKQAASLAENGFHGDGRVLLRKSGTEPVIRVMAEAFDVKKCEEAVDSIIKAIPEDKRAED